MPGGKRSVFLSNWDFEVSLSALIGTCRVYPKMLDSGKKDDKVLEGYLDVHNLLVFTLDEPVLPSKQCDLTKVLQVYRDIAYRKRPDAVELLGQALRKELYAYCQKKVVMRRSSMPTFSIPCDFDTFMASLSDEFVRRSNFELKPKPHVEVAAGRPSSLHFLLGEGWEKIRVMPRVTGRDYIDYEIHLPVWLCFSPSQGPYLHVHMKALSKYNMMGQLQWNTARIPKAKKKSKRARPGEQGEQEDEDIPACFL
mmetsp:Transcript_3023/g.6266  ORF Transcript_3023/g.6266 Transcript_3023/m.6266 type:complete len:253 (+) Transcript_3023:605-1363(+)